MHFLKSHTLILLASCLTSVQLGCSGEEASTFDEVTTRSALTSVSYSRTVGWVRSGLTRGHYDEGITLCYEINQADLIAGNNGLNILSKFGYDTANPAMYGYVKEILSSDNARAVHTTDAKGLGLFLVVPYPDDHIELFGFPPDDPKGRTTMASFDLRTDSDDDDVTCCFYERGRYEDSVFPQCACEMVTICGKNPSCPGGGCGLCAVADDDAAKEICDGMANPTIFDDTRRFDEPKLPYTL